MYVKVRSAPYVEEVAVLTTMWRMSWLKGRGIRGVAKNTGAEDGVIDDASLVVLFRYLVNNRSEGVMIEGTEIDTYGWME